MAKAKDYINLEMPSILGMGAVGPTLAVLSNTGMGIPDYDADSGILACGIPNSPNQVPHVAEGMCVAAGGDCHLQCRLGYQSRTIERCGCHREG